MAYRCIRVTFPYVFLSPFDLDVCSPFHALPFCFRLPSRIAALFLTFIAYALDVAHLQQFSKMSYISDTVIHCL